MSQAHDPPDKDFAAVDADAPFARPRLRPDLRIVYENEAQGSGRTRIRVVDPVTGRHYTFSTEEFRLCELADGRIGLPGIQAAAAAAGAEFGARDVVAFFRRLHVLGFLTADPPPDPAGHQREGRAGRLRPRVGSPARRVGATSAAGQPVGDQSGGDQPVMGQPAVSAAAGAPVSPRPGVSAAVAAVVPAAPLPRNEVPRPGDAPAAAEMPGGIVEDLPQEPYLQAAPIRTAPAEAGRASDAGPGDAPGPAANITAPAPAPVSAQALVRQRRGPRMAKTRRPPQAPAASPETPAESFAERRNAAPLAPAAIGAKDPFEIIAGNIAEFDPAAEPDFENDFAGLGGLGLGGGMMDGGMAGLGGGAGLGGWGANRERIVAALAARRGLGGGAGAGAFGAAAGRPEEDPATRVASLTLFNPTLLLRLLYVLFYPLKYLIWMIVPMVILAGLSIGRNWTVFVADHMLLTREYATITLLIIGLFTVNLASRLAQGVAILAHGGKVGAVGFVLMMGIVPRFFIDRSAIAGLSRQGQLWAHAAPLLARLGLFAAGTLTWAIMRDSGNWLPLYALMVGQFGFVMFVVTALPLLPADGQRWLAVYLDEPRLLPKAAMALRHLLTGRRLPPMIERRDIWPLALLGAGMVVTIAVLVFTLGTQLAILLEAEMGGVGVSLFLMLALAFLFWLMTLRVMIGRRVTRMRAQGRAMGELAGQFGGGAAADPLLGRVVRPDRGPAVAARPLAGQMALAQAADPAEAQASGARVVWGVILAGLLAVAFLPYTYETGGAVEILPAARAQAVARTSGELVEILVVQGDMVTRGQLLARMSSWDQENGVKVTQAMLDGAEANLARLEAGAKPEEMELATRELKRAQASLDYSQAAADRARELVVSGTISQQAFEQAIAAYETDLAGLEVAQANLDLVQSGATPEEIAIAAAEVARLAQELAFREDELARTRIEAPMDGRVVTADLELRHGSFLTVGEPLVEIEDAGTVTATVAVPEADIGLVAPGDLVRLRIWGQSGSEIAGSVQQIAPVATAEGQSNVVAVEATFPNAEGLLRSGMSGYAKIEGAEMRVWEAYLRSIRRFFQIEVWSWIP